MTRNFVLMLVIGCWLFIYPWVALGILDEDVFDADTPLKIILFVLAVGVPYWLCACVPLFARTRARMMAWPAMPFTIIEAIVFCAGFPVALLVELFRSPDR